MKIKLDDKNFIMTLINRWNDGDSLVIPIIIWNKFDKSITNDISNIFDVRYINYPRSNDSFMIKVKFTEKGNYPLSDFLAPIL